MTQLLQNKIFISTRPAGRSDELSLLLNEAGATVLEFPLIQIKAATLSNEEKKHFSRLKEFQWLILTSPNGVRYFFDIMLKVAGNQELPKNIKIAAIGEKTRETLKKHGYSATFVNPGSTAEDFTKPFVRHIEAAGSGQKILLPLGNLARTVIQDELKEWADCTRIDVYRTEMPETINTDIAERIENEKFDMLIFTSPSGIQNFLKLFPKLNIQNIRMGCIGETTATAAREKGFRPLVVAQNSSSAGIVESILNYYISKT
ncbi:MAG: uroporphyrinogen-III synthase [Mariniphaga sp.]|nr:uroporphyrinogen-III synthase [Mariniphaga sp.]